MHRTQILLEEWQYDALKASADKQGVSLSELVREIVSRHLHPKRVKRPLDEIAGIGEDGASVAREHDGFLYGKQRKSR